MSYWWSDIEAKAFTTIKTRVRAQLPQYNIIFTTENQTYAPAEFPTVYMRPIEGLEMGIEVSSDEISAFMAGLQIEVYSEDTIQTSTIMDECVKQSKRLGYSLNAMPIITNQANLVRGIARFRRCFASGDSI